MGVRQTTTCGNLEWCTNSENTKHAYSNGLKITKAVKQYDLDNNFIREYKSIKEATEINGIDSGDIIKCCKGKLNRAGNYIWKYKGTR